MKSGVFTVVTMQNSVFRDVTPCGFCENGLFTGNCRLRHRAEQISELVTASAITNNLVTC
jgi:hypothetical protein